MLGGPYYARLHPDEVAYSVSHDDCRALLFGPGGDGAADRCEVPLSIEPGEFERLVSEDATHTEAPDT